METAQDKTGHPERRKRTSNHVLAGIVLLIVGGVLFAERAGADLPHWLFTWPMIPIVVGIFIGVKEGFRDWGWMIPVTVGVLFLLSYNVEGFPFRQMWPIIIIIVGLAMILNSFGKGRRSCL